MPLYAGSVSGKCFPISPSAAAPSSASMMAWSRTIRIRMSQEPLFIRYFHATDDQVSSAPPDDVHHIPFRFSYLQPFRRRYLFSKTTGPIVLPNFPTGQFPGLYARIRTVPGVNIVCNILKFCPYFLATAQSIRSSVLSNT